MHALYVTCSLSWCLQQHGGALQGGIDKRVIEKFEKEAAEMNKRSFKYAWVSPSPLECISALYCLVAYCFVACMVLLNACQSPHATNALD